jgi:hypothetical protein
MHRSLRHEGLKLCTIPSEGELLIKLALSCDQAQALNDGYATIPNNVDFAILEAVSVLPTASAICACHGNVHFYHVSFSGG